MAVALQWCRSSHVVGTNKYESWRKLADSRDTLNNTKASVAYFAGGICSTAAWFVCGVKACVSSWAERAPGSLYVHP